MHTPEPTPAVTSRHRPAPAASGTHWLSARRVRIYCTVLLLLACPAVADLAWSAYRAWGQPLGFDFLPFWSASRLALDGTPLAAYDYDATTRIAGLVAPRMPPPGPWSYPPVFLMMIWPAALLPYWLSYLCFEVLTGIVLISVLRKIVPTLTALLAILAFPGLWLNGLQGQNGFLTATFAACALLLLERRPVLAGVFVGLLSIKPQLAVGFPIALAFARLWPAFISAAVTTAALSAAAALLFGAGTLAAFLNGLQTASRMMAEGSLPWNQSASLFSALRMLDVATPAAYALQGCAGAAALGCIAWVWARTREPGARAMALVAGTFLVSPYLYNYDTVWLAVPIALFSARALHTGWLRGEREILLAAWLYPPLGVALARLFKLGTGPLLFAVLLWLVIRRVQQERAPMHETPTLKEQS